MRQKPYQIGTLAAKLIMDRISSEAAEPEERTTIKVDAELIIRNSTAAPPTAG
jgi:DNA-binding LacI/PurR family transcriptional regulator